MRKHTPVFLLALSLLLSACSSDPSQPAQPKQPVAPKPPALPDQPRQPKQPKQPKPPPPVRVIENSPGTKFVQLQAGEFLLRFNRNPAPVLTPV